MSTYLNISDKIKLNSGPSPLLLNFYEGAAAAYSLRKLDALYNGDAITVRRASDNNTQNIGFVNNELDTASLESFVNSGQTFDNPEITSATGWTIGGNTTYNASTEAFDLVNENGLTVRQWQGVAGHTYAITIVLNNVISGGVKVYAGGNQSAVYSTDGTHTFNITAGSSNEILGINPNGLANLSISSFYAVDITGDGFVTTWYDQSGNGLDATQATASSQPKIVSLGSVILENNKPTVSFSGNYLDTNIISPLISQPITTFSTYKANNNRFIYDNVNSSDVFRLQSTYPDFYPIISAGVSLTATSSSVSSFGLTTAIYNGANSFIYRNSIELVNGNAGSNSFEGLTIGANRNGLDNLSGFISEIILYSSNESANRTGIETNINNFYSIY